MYTIPKFYWLSWKAWRIAIEYWWQDLTRGWDDSQLWSLDSTLGEWLAPRLKRFKEVNNGHPCELTSEQWDQYLDEMIWCFEEMGKGDWNHPWMVPGLYPKEQRRKYKKYWARRKRAMDLFSKYSGHLWW